MLFGEHPKQGRPRTQMGETETRAGEAPLTIDCFQVPHWGGTQNVNRRDAKSPTVHIINPHRTWIKSIWNTELIHSGYTSNPQINPFRTHWNVGLVRARYFSVGGSLG